MNILYRAAQNCNDRFAGLGIQAAGFVNRSLLQFGLPRVRIPRIPPLGMYRILTPAGVVGMVAFAASSLCVVALWKATYRLYNCSKRSFADKKIVNGCLTTAAALATSTLLLGIVYTNVAALSCPIGPRICIRLPSHFRQGAFT